MSEIESKHNKMWTFVVGMSNIVSCVVSFISCCIACNAVEEIINLDVKIEPIVQKFQRDSIVTMKTIPVMVPCVSDTIEKPIEPDVPHIIEPDVPYIEVNPAQDENTSKYLSDEEVDKIREPRDSFIKKMQDNMKYKKL